MAADASFVDFVLRTDEHLHEDQGGGQPALRVARRRFRDRLNPMELFSDREFLARYRFSKATVASLLEMLPLEASASNRGLPVPPMLQLLIALRFYGAGTFQVVTGDLVNVSQPTVCRVVRRVLQLIANTLFRRIVKFPDSAADFDDVTLEFYQMKKFPGVTGCIDCTHAITGPQLQFFDLLASWPGSVHDSRIFDNSRARVLYEQHRVPGLLLGDAGYGCMPFLMTPLSSPVAEKTPEASGMIRAPLLDPFRPFPYHGTEDGVMSCQ
ncbi:hypothetical protein HPB47_001635 [Ixodes persulcatus]|uniref:Uncharacterized protein n=1 Tax=Ixodes persulcatus TaxID=34615 RepID=A0AC60PPN0_IXOPE|nr:hypothetical protein HPB47_001635 [Ixodes persulcatus]